MGGGVEENMELNKIFFILLKINKLFLDMSKKIKSFAPKKKCFLLNQFKFVWPVGYILITSLFLVELRPELS